MSDDHIPNSGTGSRAAVPPEPATGPQEPTGPAGATTVAVVDRSRTDIAPDPEPRPRRGGTPPGRVVGLDVARGIAVLGMFAAHLVSTPEVSWTDPSTWTGLVNGRSAILFATLAGLSIGIMTAGRPRRSVALLQARMKIVTRAVLILLVGVVLEAFGTSIAVILGTYALLFLMMLPFVAWSLRRLVMLTLGSAVVGATVGFVLLPWLDLGHGDESGVTSTIIGGVYPAFIWFTFFAAGLTLSRLNLRSLRTQAMLLVGGVALVAAAHLTYTAVHSDDDLPAGGSETVGSTDAGFVVATPTDIPVGYSCVEDATMGVVYCYDPASSTEASVDQGGITISVAGSLVTERPHSGSPFEVVGSGGFAVAVIGLCLLACRVRALRGLLWPLGAVGSMALTAYSLHIVAIGLGDGEMGGSWGTWAVFAVGALVFCSSWKAFLGRGPLERLLAVVARRATSITPTTPQ